LQEAPQKEFASAGILLVHEDGRSLSGLAGALREAGYPRVTLISGPTGALLGSNAPDVIVFQSSFSAASDWRALQGLIGLGDPSLGRGVIVATPNYSPELGRRVLRAGAMYCLSAPIDVEETCLRIRNVLRLRLQHVRFIEQRKDLEAKVEERNGNLWATMNELHENSVRLHNSQEETLRRLARAAEYRDDETAGHVERLSSYVGAIARAAGKGDEEVRLIRLASRLHDIGKIGVPDSILLKPGPLSDEERSTMERHAQIGHEILCDASSDLINLAATIALTHHEKYDGTGYPDKCRGEDVPFEGRVTAIADAFDALSSDRVYRKALPIYKTLEIMKAERGKHFDPVLLDLFFECLPEILSIRESHPE
jgi:putative two-component system response regulator